jgi:hypothetical protein
VDDFNKPKIIWKVIGSKLAFAIDENRYIVNNACYLMTGEKLNLMLPFLNSRVINWFSDITNMNATGVGDAQVGAQNIVMFPIPLIDHDIVDNISTLSDMEVENIVFDIYGLTYSERDYILSIYPISEGVKP